MIRFEECKSSGYKARTLENAKADVTIAIAKDYTTAGERCTVGAVRLAGKLYQALPVEDINYDIKPNAIDVTINNARLGSIIDNIAKLDKPEITLNVAGNGIYAFSISQHSLDMIITSVISIISYKLEKRSIVITLIRSGGQTGIDEAALKAAKQLVIPALCLAPKGWVFRNRYQKDIADEQLFKARFY